MFPFTKLTPKLNNENENVTRTFFRMWLYGVIRNIVMQFLCIIILPNVRL